MDPNVPSSSNQAPDQTSNFPSFSQEGLFQGADLGPLPSTAYSPFGTVEMDIVWGNANAEVTSAPPPAATNALREGVVTQETLPEMPQVPVSGPAVPDPPAEVPAQRLQGDAQETATQAPAEGVSEEGEIAAEVPKKQSSKARWKNKKGKDEHRNAILFCQGGKGILRLDRHRARARKDAGESSSQPRNIYNISAPGMENNDLVASLELTIPRANMTDLGTYTNTYFTSNAFIKFKVDSTASDTIDFS